MVLNRHFPVGAAITAQTNRRTFDTTILEVESTSYRAFAPYFCAERGFEPVFGGMVTQQRNQECISLSMSNPSSISPTGLDRHTGNGLPLADWIAWTEVRDARLSRAGLDADPDEVLGGVAE